jgi:hypothetical protein
VVTPVGACNGSGTCTQTPQPPCSYTQCSGTACAASCTADNGCINADYCSTTSGGTCQPRHGNGTTCTPDDCESPPCNFCGAAKACRGSGQCCAMACPGPTCTDVAMGASTFVTSNCNAGGTCNGSNAGCNGFVCASTSACKTAPCVADTDCDQLSFCKADGTCAARVDAMGSCADTDCKVTGCRECSGTLMCTGGKCK